MSDAVLNPANVADEANVPDEADAPDEIAAPDTPPLNGVTGGPAPTVDDLDSAIANLRSLTGQAGLTDPLKAVIHRLLVVARRCEELPHKHRGLTASFVADGTNALVGSSPNIGVAEKLTDNAELQYNWHRSWSMRLVYRWGHGRTGMAAVAGLLLALGPIVVLGLLYLVGAQVFFPNAAWLVFDLDQLAVLLFAALLGAVASQAMSIPNLPETGYDPGAVSRRSFFKVLVALIFSIAVYAVLSAGIVSIEGLDFAVGQTGSDDAAEADTHSVDLMKIVVLGFLCGFSERFAPQIIDQAGARGS